ncbi:MAG: phosphate-binding protein [Epsilonproteobacteria bacterium]|nr:MAG: phosphate-binding protein [Campylobacterota bacterium]
MIKKIQILAALVIATTLGAGEINYVGSSTVGKFIIDAQKVYKTSTFKINTNPESSGGENAVAAKKIALGGVARDVKESILKRGVEKVLIGKDAIGIWVHSTNSVEKLSSAQLKDIFTGKITNWKTVGGKDADINVYIVNKNSATRKVFQKVILNGAKYKGKNIRTVKPDPKILEKVRNDKNGIGQLSFAFGIGAKDVKKIAVNGQEASVQNSSYPITRPLYLITNGAPTGDVKAFIEWSLSPDGQSIVKKYFVGK